MSKHIVVLYFFFFTSLAAAKYEYAAKQNINCTACHLNPWGGGPRNVYGKIYGSKNFSPSKISLQDTYAASLRGVAYYPRDSQNASNGLGVMEVSVSANVVPVEATPETAEVRIVGTYNAAPTMSSVREAYMRVIPAGASSTYISVGRINVPFGLLTDEHRTYTRLQTNSTLNNFVTGGAISAALAPNLFYDFALTQDLQGGNFSGAGAGPSYAATLNARYFASFAPLILGASQNIQHMVNQPEPYATSVYSVFSIDRLTSGSFPLALLLEGVTARNWNTAVANPGLAPFFIPISASSYQTAINNSQSLGIYTLLRYDVTPSWNIFYKWDSLTPDTNYFGDVFLRSGLGVEVQLNSNTYLNARIERADVTRPEVASTSTFAAESDFIAMLRVWL